MRRGSTPSKMDKKEPLFFPVNVEPPAKLQWTRREKRQWTCTLMFGTAVVYAARTIMPVCIVQVADEMKWDKTESGTVLSAFFWGYMMTQVLGGYVSDRVGGERVMLLASAIWSSVTLCTPVLIQLSVYTPAFSFYIIVLFRVLLGVSQGVHFPSVTSAMARKIPSDERSLTFSLVATGANCGTLLSGSMGSFLMEQYGWQKSFYAIGVAGLLWAVTARRWLIRGSSLSEPFGSKLQSSGTDQNSNTALPVPWMKLFCSAAFWALLVANYCTSNSSYILLSWLPTFFHENYPDAKSWVFNVVPWLVILPCNVMGGWVADRLIKSGFEVTAVRKLLAIKDMHVADIAAIFGEERDKKLSIFLPLIPPVARTLLFCGTAAFLGLISYMDSFESTLICMTLAISCCGFHSSSIAMNPVDLAPQHSGAVFGILNTTSAITGFVGVYMAGYILETTKSWSAVFNQTAAICIFGYIVFLLLGTGRRII